MAQVKGIAAASAITVLLWAGLSSAQATGTTTATTTTPPPVGIDVTPATNPDLGDPGAFVIDQISGFRGRVGGGVQYYGPLGVAYNNFSTTLAPQITLSASNPNIVTTETSIKSWSIWFAPSLDYFIVQNISVGALLAVDAGFGSASTKTTTQSLTGSSSANASGDLPTVTSFTLMPRVGYLLRINDRLSFWPRLGVGYFSGSNALVSAGADSTGKLQQITTTTNVHSLIMQFDVGLIYQVTDNVFFRIAPSVTFSTGGAGKVTYTASNGNTPPDQTGDGSVFQFELTSGFGANFSL